MHECIHILLKFDLNPAKYSLFPWKMRFSKSYHTYQKIITNYMQFYFENSKQSIISKVEKSNMMSTYSWFFLKRILFILISNPFNNMKYLNQFHFIIICFVVGIILCLFKCWVGWNSIERFIHYWHIFFIVINFFHLFPRK